jgi:hypothetical protein
MAGERLEQTLLEALTCRSILCAGVLLYGPALAQDVDPVSLRWEVPEDLLPEVYGTLDFKGEKKA